MRVRIQAEVVAIKRSEFKKDSFYVTVKADGFGEFKFLSHRPMEVGDTVMLQDQPNRTMTDPFMWKEVRK